MSQYFCVSRRFVANIFLSILSIIWKRSAVMVTHNGQGICDVAADLFGQPVPQFNNDLTRPEKR